MFKHVRCNKNNMKSHSSSIDRGKINVVFCSSCFSLALFWNVLGREEEWEKTHSGSFIRQIKFRKMNENFFRFPTNDKIACSWRNRNTTKFTVLCFSSDRNTLCPLFKSNYKCINFNVFFVDFFPMALADWCGMWRNFALLDERVKHDAFSQFSNTFNQIDEIFLSFEQWLDWVPYDRSRCNHAENTKLMVRSKLISVGHIEIVINGCTALHSIMVWVLIVEKLK